MGGNKDPQALVSKNSIIFACIPCSENVFTEPSPCNERRDTYRDWWEGFMKYAVEI
jgi:hypothetical protein